MLGGQKAKSSGIDWRPGEVKSFSSCKSFEGYPPAFMISGSQLHQVGILPRAVRVAGHLLESHGDVLQHAYAALMSELQAL